MFQKTREAKQKRQALQKAMGELQGIQRELDSAYSNFNLTTDDSLQSAYIYEISALRARYNYAVCSIKNLFS